MTHPEYTIKEVGDFLKVPKDRLDACLEEFTTFLQVSRSFMEMANAMAGLLGADKSQNVLESFVWIDDGERNATIHMRPIVVTVEVPDAKKLLVDSLESIIAAMVNDPDYAWGWHCNIAMAAHDSGAGPHDACNRGAALFLNLLSDGRVDTTTHPAYAQTQDSKSQDGQEAKSSGSYPENAGSSPAPATTQKPVATITLT